MILSNTSSALTIEARIYPRDYKTDSGYTAQEIVSLFQVYNSATDAAEWVLYDEPPKTPDAPRLYASGRVFVNITNWSQAVTLNTWHSLKVTFATNGITSAYID